MAQDLTQQLTAALREAVRALNIHPRFRVQETDSYTIASLCDAALRAARDHGPHPKEAADIYQGWTNRETWAVSLHLNNDKAAYDTCRAFAKACGGNRQLLADRLSSYVVSSYLRFSARITNPMHADLMEAAITRIDFSEIAQDFLEE
jgi:hypothetical protein